MAGRHVFVSERGEPMPRWLEAFPDALFSTIGQRPRLAGAPVLWLHLDPSGRDTAQQVAEAMDLAHGVPVVVLSNTPNQAEGLASLEAGAAGYVSALAAPAMLWQVVEVVTKGGLWVGPDLLARLRSALSARSAMPAQSPDPDRLLALSQRERQVAIAVAGGASNKEIARSLGITERTVKAHLSAIFERLKVRDRLQLSILINGEPRSSDHPVH